MPKCPDELETERFCKARRVHASKVKQIKSLPRDAGHQEFGIPVSNGAPGQNLPKKLLMSKKKSFLLPSAN